ncbi:hypothetical protein PYV61_23820 [Roseisolibacter sp. H3M3-2]|nr:hypothetical protein [Roseisolibacter sp. H3M3-2]MDF1506002.1 hypothetical protein [Roseisolibacter sp. H3M3-2]
MPTTAASTHTKRDAPPGSRSASAAPFAGPGFQTTTSGKPSAAMESTGAPSSSTASGEGAPR